MTRAMMLLLCCWMLTNSVDAGLSVSWDGEVFILTADSVSDVNPSGTLLRAIYHVNGSVTYYLQDPFPYDTWVTMSEAAWFNQARNGNRLGASDSERRQGREVLADFHALVTGGTYESSWTELFPGQAFSGSANWSKRPFDKWFPPLKQVVEIVKREEAIEATDDIVNGVVGGCVNAVGVGFGAALASLLGGLAARRMG